MADSAHFMESICGYTRQQQDQALWEMMTALAGKRFYTAKKLEYTYRIRGGEMFVDRKEKSITQAMVFIAFHRALELGEKATGPKSWGLLAHPTCIRFFKASALCPESKTVFPNLQIVEKVLRKQKKN